jgi:glycosyltransferase involved in cell wall biosynthesis
LKNRIELGLERRLYTGGGTRHFVVNSTLVARQLRETYGVPGERLTVIHTAVDTDHFHPAATPPRNKRPTFLFVSSHHRRKGLDALLDAVSHLADAELWIAGAPVGARYRRRIRRWRLDGRINVLGSVDDLAPVYRQVDFFVHPTLYDACANTVLQAMASGLVCLVSTADGASEFIAPGRSGFILDRPADASAIGATMSEALKLSAGERVAIGAAARERMLPLTWDAHIDQWLDVLDRIE